MNIDKCDHERINSFLNSENNQSDSLLFSHLGECERCREYFDQQIASDDEWACAGRMLQPDVYDRATKYWFSAGSNTGQRVRQSVAIKEVLETLTPTDDPHRMGRLGKYEVMGVIGAGGMGVVLKAFELSLDRVVAIKVLAPHLANNEQARQRFDREARAAAAVINPNVIPIYSVASESKLPYLVMTYLQGGSLQQRLDSNGPASIPEVLRIGSQIASGLAAAHEQGLVHRDIKPENVLFEGDVERAVITDFGLARAVDDNTVTQAGTIAGTPMYMSPEQARGERVDQQSDLFSLGSVLYAISTGEPPFRADSSLGVMRKITDESPTPICELNPDVPEWLAAIISKLMERDKTNRYHSAREVQKLLESCLSHVQAPDTVSLPDKIPSSRNTNGSHWKKVAVGSLLITIAAAFSIYLSGGFGTGQFNQIADQQENAQLGSQAKNQKTLADLSSSELAMIYQQITGVELGGGMDSDKPNPSLANSVSVLLDYDTISREKVAKTLVDLGEPELAKIVLSDGRVDPSAAEALQLGDLLLAAGDGERAVNAYLEAFRVAPHLFMSKYISTFDEQGRLKDLAELYTEKRLSKTRAISEQNSLLQRLMKDDTRASIGLPYMARVWKSRPDLRVWILNEVPWNEVPNRVDYFGPLLIPTNFEEVGNGWQELFDESNAEGGWLYCLRDKLDKETARQLIAEVRPKVQEHENWVAGSLILTVLEATTGDYEPAIHWIENNYETVKPYKQDSDQDQFLAEYAGFVGSLLEGKNRELDLLVIKLYEQALEHRRVDLPYRETNLHQLAKLYHKHGRTNDAVELLYGLVVRQSEADEYLINNWFRPETVNLDHERIWDIRSASETLNSIGRPVDSLSLLSRIDYPMRDSAGEYKGGGFYYDDKDVEQAISKSKKLVRAETIVEALNRGVLPIGLASTINTESNEIENPIVELLEQIARNELSDEFKTAFERVNSNLTDADALDRHLADLTKQHPADTDIAVAATIFAFLRNDFGTACDRLKKLTSMSEANRNFRAADVSLYLAVEHALNHEETVDMGRRLSTRAIQAGERMNEDWKLFFNAKITERRSATGK